MNVSVFFKWSLVWDGCDVKLELNADLLLNSNADVWSSSWWKKAVWSAAPVPHCPFKTTSLQNVNRYQLCDCEFSLFIFCLTNRKCSKTTGTLNLSRKNENNPKWRHIVFTRQQHTAAHMSKINLDLYLNILPLKFQKIRTSHSSITAKKVSVRHSVVLRDGTPALLSMTVSEVALIMIRETTQTVPLG